MQEQEYVLVVDDDPWAVEITTTMLERNEIVVRAAQNQSEAMATVRELGSPAVMLLDVMMPDVNGFDVCRALRGEPTLRHTRIVFLTSLSDERSRLAALEAGADDIIAKPVSEAVLVARIRSLAELAYLRDRNQQYLEYQAVLDSIGEGVITLGDDDRILTANLPARRLLGLPEAGATGIDLPGFVASAWDVERGSLDRASTARLVWRSSRPGPVAAVDWTSRQLPGSAETHAAWTVVLSDATDEMEQDRAVGRLIRTLGHKLRTPLTGVSASFDLLWDAIDDEESRMLVEIGRDSSERLRQTLVRILEYTNAVAPVDSNHDLATLEPSDAAEQLGIDESVALDVRLAGPVAVDVGFAKENIAELVANAHRAGAAEVVVRVEAGASGTVTFAVSDDGPGLPPGIEERIFEPFYQSDRSGEAAGAGLGLAIVAAGVEARHGRFGAHSPHGEPTTVWFTLPAHATDALTGSTRQYDRPVGLDPAV